MNGPSPVAQGENGRWERMGRVSVDGACIGITDPAAIAEPKVQWDDYDARGERWGSGVRFWSGFGDGSYDVWGWIADYSEPDEEPDERVAQVVITMIDDEDLTAWRRM